MSEVSLDIRQLLQLIYLDVYEGVTPFIKYTRNEEGLEIRAVRIRAGNIPFDTEGKIVPSGDILKDPLLAAENAWQVEMLFGEDLPETSKGIESLTATELFSTKAGASCTLFYPFPVGILQNAGVKTTEWLKSAGVAEIGHLCNLTEETLKKLIRERPAFNLLELHTKARLLETPVPAISPVITGKESLYVLSQLTVREMLSKFPSGSLDARGCKSLLNYLGLLSTCLNDSFLKKKNLGWLKG
jgi:hypothetical protein